MAFRISWQLQILAESNHIAGFGDFCVLLANTVLLVLTCCSLHVYMESGFDINFSNNLRLGQVPMKTYLSDRTKHLSKYNLLHKF